MAENLVGRGFLSSKENSVEQVLNNAENLIRTMPQNEMADFIAEMEDIKRRVEQNEFYFYQAFGAKDFKGLNARLAQIEQAYAPLLAGGAAIWHIRKNINFDNLSNAHSPEEIREGLTIAIEDFLQNDGRAEELEAKLLNLGEGETIEQQISSFVQKGLKDKKGFRFITSRAGTRVGLGKFIVGYDFEKHTVILNAEGVQVSSSFRKRIEETLNLLLPDRVRKRGASTYTSDGFRRRINELALEKIIDPEAKKYLQLAMKNKEQFDLKPNLSSVIGYLGEVRAVALLNHLAPDGFSEAKGVGNVYGKFAASGRVEEIPIDVVCAAWGF